MAHHYTFSVVKHPSVQKWGILATCSECGPQEIVETYESELLARQDLDTVVALYNDLYGDEDTTFKVDPRPTRVFPDVAII